MCRFTNDVVYKVNKQVQEKLGILSSIRDQRVGKQGSPTSEDVLVDI